MTTSLANAGGTGNALANKPPRQTVMDLVLAKKDAIAAVATKHLTAEKLVKVFGVALARTPKLAQCTPMTLLNAIMTCAELGLAPNNGLGSVYLIPFNNRRNGTMECQLIIGYRGMCELARRSGQITTIQAEVVREGDEFEYEYGLNMTFRHKPKPGGGPVTHAWALAKFRDGSHQLVVMSRGEIDSIRSRSKSKDDGPWVTDPAEMAKKTAVRRLCKMLPLTPEVEATLAVADRGEFKFEMPELGADEEEGEEGDGEAGPALEAAKNSTNKLLDDLRAKKAAEAGGPEEINTATGEVVIDRKEAQESPADPLAGSTPTSEPMPGTAADPDGGMFDPKPGGTRRRSSR